jgi:gliding motility-associated-like protein
VTKVGLFTPAPTLAGQQTLTYTITQNGCEGKGTKTINILPSPPQNLLPPDDFWCEETPKRINAPEIPGASYRWSSGETTQFIQPNASGKYTLTVNLATCQSKDTITITIAQNPKLFNVKTDLSLCVIEGAVATLDPGEAKGWTYSWQPRGEKTRKLLVDKVGTYTVTVTSAEGCPTVQPIVVENKCEPRIVVPEIFTPNGDGINDAMDVFVAHISDFEIKVYNRWGEVVFVSDDPNLKWDGRYRELFYPTQSYAWVVTYRSLYFPERPQGTKRGAVVVAK